MKIILTESQYDRILLEQEKLSVGEMEEKMKYFFSSADDYKKKLEMFIRLYFQYDSDDIEFYWYPKLNTDVLKTFSLRCYFPKSTRNNLMLQFSFDSNKMENTILGSFNAVVDSPYGTEISRSLRLLDIQSGRPSVYLANIEDIRVYVREWAKSIKKNSPDLWT